MELLAILFAATSFAWKVGAFIFVCLVMCLYGHLTAQEEPGNVGDDYPILDHHEEMISK